MISLPAFGGVYAAAERRPCIRNTARSAGRVHGSCNSSVNGLQLQRFQITMVDRSRKDDLGAGGAQLLELQDQVLQLGHAAAADLDEEGVGTGDMVALQHFLAVCISSTSSSRWLGVTDRLMSAST